MWIIKKKKNKSHMMISIDAEQAFEIIERPFMIKSLNRNGIERK